LVRIKLKLENRKYLLTNDNVRKIYIMKKSVVCFLMLVFLAGSVAGQSKVSVDIDWPEFMSGQDMVWTSMPAEWQHSPWTGNGIIGSMLYKDRKTNRLRLQVFRSDVQDHRPFDFGHAGYSRFRIQIGSFYIEPKGAITGCNMRLDLYNAQLIGEITTDKGKIIIKHLTHTNDLVIFTEFSFEGDEGECKWQWEPSNADTTRFNYPKTVKDISKVQGDYRSKYPTRAYIHNPQPQVLRYGDIDVCHQSLLFGGQHTTAWKVFTKNNKQYHVATIAKSWPDEEQRSILDAIDTITAAASIKDYTGWLNEHYQWWNSYYPESFISLPDRRVEAVYWAQMYKLASATREDRPMMDTAGIWQVASKWPFVTWDLNVQLCYWPHNTANRMHIGMSLINALNKYKANLIDNVRPVEWQKDSICIGVNSGLDCHQPFDVDLRPQWALASGHLIWVMHNGYLQYRYTMDKELLRDKIYPLLRRAVNFGLHRLYEENGKYHVIKSSSPEYRHQAVDANYEVASIRWGCQALLETSKVLKNNDPLIPKWKDVLKRLVDYPADPKEGFMIGKDMPFSRMHRHYSHLLMIYPYYLVNIEQPGAKEMVQKSVSHFMKINSKATNYGGCAAYTMTGASLMYAAIEDGQKALEYLNGFIDYPLVRRNSMYAEAGPCLESPLSAAQCVHEMILQSWGDKIRVFPAVPDSWKDIMFHDLRTAGAFLVSASRKNGKTEFIRIKSLAGEPCVLKFDMNSPQAIGSRQFKLKKTADKIYSLDIKKGEEAIIKPYGSTCDLTITSVKNKTGKPNWYGLN